jgi:hypothetical protein
MRLGVILVTALALLVSLAPGATAEPGPDRAALIGQRLHELWMGGVPDTIRFARVEAEFGIDILSAPAGIEAQDVNNDVVDVPKPTVWYDGFAEYPYGASASFRWRYNCGRDRKQACWLDHGASRGDNGSPVGGDDGFALQIDALAKFKGGGLILDPNCNDKNLFFTNPSDRSDWGVGYRQPDKVDLDPRHCGRNSEYREYTWDAGEVHTTFALARRCETPRIFVKSKLGHTWDTTHITGIGISVDGIDIHWQDKGHDLEAFPDEEGFHDCHY